MDRSRSHVSKHDPWCAGTVAQVLAAPKGQMPAWPNPESPTLVSWARRTAQNGSAAKPRSLTRRVAARQPLPRGEVTGYTKVQSDTAQAATVSSRRLHLLVGETVITPLSPSTCITVSKAAERLRRSASRRWALAPCMRDGWKSLES